MFAICGHISFIYKGVLLNQMSQLICRDPLVVMVAQFPGSWRPFSCSFVGFGAPRAWNPNSQKGPGPMVEEVEGILMDWFFHSGVCVCVVFVFWLFMFMKEVWNKIPTYEVLMK